MQALAAPDMHTQSAFTFAKHKDWSEAIAHAKAAGSPLLAKYFTWQYLKDPESNASFAEITDFMEKNSDWPDQQALEKRAEVALMTNNPSDQEVNEWFEEHPPQTSSGKLRNGPIANVVREAWINDDYNKSTELAMLAKYNNVLRAQDHAARIDRLLWEGKTDAAKRTIKLLPERERQLFVARMALADDKMTAPQELSEVASQYRNDPGLLYERIKWRERGNDREGVRELLLQTPLQVTYPEKWWPMRDRQIRYALNENNPSLASKLLQKHAQKSGTQQYLEAMWLSGFIALNYEKNPAKAQRIFMQLYDQSTTPHSKTRMAYWAGRALAAGNSADAALWYSRAADYPTTFYGQLGAVELKEISAFHPRNNTVPTAEDKANFKQRDLVKLVYALGRAGESDAAAKFILYLVETAPTPGEKVLAVQLGKDIERPDLSVKAAKKAFQSDVLSLENAYPVIPLRNNSELEKSLILGLTRQESEFNTEVISPSNAHGLMQLLPTTAKEVARKMGMAFSRERLFDPAYNTTLGSFYLRHVLNVFDGSYILSIASYNAGPGRVRQWVRDYGRPGQDAHSAVDWIERIPNSETRYYVQRVLENTQVYRFLLGGSQSTKLKLAEDLAR